MKTNSLLTYVLYALLGGLIIVAGYKACQIRQEQTDLQKENAKLEEVMRDRTYSDDSTAGGSAYLGADSTAQPTTTTVNPTASKPTSTTPAKPSVSTTGIENDDPAPRSQPGTTSGSAPTVVTKPVTTAKSPGLTGKPPVISGRYMVITGAFRSKENARDEMETLVKAGYRNAEVKLFTSAWAHVIALRTNDRAAADRAVEKLKSEGYASTYVKTQ